jgi:putative aldouronate transport system permease protein
MMLAEEIDYPILVERKKGWIQKRHLPLHLMMLPGVIILLIYSYGPMVGIVMAFQKFMPSKGIFGSKFIGLDNFVYLFKIPSMDLVIFNTVFIAMLKIITTMLFAIVFALLLNEVKTALVKRGIQTVIYLPFFLSWVILAGIFKDLLSPSTGIINSLIKFLGFEPVFFLGNANLFPWVIISTNLWKEFGYGTIIYLAALTNLDPNLYEAAAIDGAGRWQQTLYITLPGIAPIVGLMAVLSLGNVLNAGFDQIFNLYSPVVYRTGDVLDTFVYRIGLEDAQYSVATAVGLFKSIVSFLFISTSYWAASRYLNYRIF